MQYNRYIFAQLLRTTISVTLVIVGIVWLFQTIRLLELVINRGASLTDFLVMSLSVIPLWLTIAVPIGTFVAVNWVFHRILADRELTVMQAIGLSPMQIAAAPIALGLVVTASMLVNSAFILPYSFSIYKEFQFKIRNNIPAILLQDNVFIDVVDGMTILIGNHKNSSVAENMFIHDTRDPGKIITLTAKRGMFVNQNGAPALILQDGQRAELDDDASSSAILLFDSHTLSITASGSSKSERMSVDMNEDSIANLLDPTKSPSPNYILERWAEGHYRIAAPFLALAMVLIATATILHGQIRRDLWLRRVITNIVLGVSVIVALVVSRSIVTTTPNLVMLIYAGPGVPIILSFWLLSRATRRNGAIAAQNSEIPA